MNYKSPYKLVKHPEDAGRDIRAIDDEYLEPMEIVKVHTGVYLELDPDLYADVRGRSGLTSKGIDVKLGTIDSGYRGEIMVTVINLSGYGYIITAGDRIAQLVYHKKVEVDMVHVDEIDSDTDRGCKGFGSSGRC